MDLETMMVKLRRFVYASKQQFVDDLNLIWANYIIYRLSVSTYTLSVFNENEINPEVRFANQLSQRSPLAYHTSCGRQDTSLDPQYGPLREVAPTEVGDAGDEDRE